MANYSDFLANFDFDVTFKPTKENANADYCSRASIAQTINNVKAKGLENNEWLHDEFDSFIVKQIQQLPLQAPKIAKETRSDDQLGKIVRLLEAGKDLKRCGFKSPEVNYKLMSGCLLFEHRVVIPPSLQRTVLKDLHLAHIGIVKMKGLARSFIYWPGLDTDIEKMANLFENCNKNAHNPPQYAHHWAYPKGPWVIIQRRTDRRRDQCRL